MTDLDASPSLMLASDSFQLTFCFCLFGFFGTILSTSWYLHWSHQKTNNLNDMDSDENDMNHSKKLQNNYVYRHNPIQPHDSQLLSKQKQVALYAFQSPQHGIRVSHLQQHSRHRQQQQYYGSMNRYLQPQKLHNQTSVLFDNTTQIILDWDDTLFPTAYTLLNLKNGINSSLLLCDNEWSRLSELSNMVLYVLLMFVQYFGAENIIIVTNARMDWFNQSCQIYNKLYGEIKNILLNKYAIPIISAHDSYSRQKSAAFMDILQHKYHINKVLCFGDSNEEYDAIHNVCNALNMRERQQINYYRFKFIQSPSVDAMIKQLQVIKNLDFETISKQRFNSSYHFKPNTGGIQ